MFLECPTVNTVRFLWILTALQSGQVLAGPPFRTDDPQPVDYRHWEFYAASVQQFGRTVTAATAPHIEVNYGAVPDVQLHIVVPFEYVHANGGNAYGFSDLEVGVKYRFVNESESLPQIGVFPLVELPTGDVSRQLGSGQTQVFLPLWIQKSWGKLTTYGGGGYWINPGPDQRDWIFAGWQAQYDFSEVVTLGAEVYYQTADAQDAEAAGGLAIGGFFNLSEHSHILFSYGRTVSGDTFTTGYVGYQLTI